MVLIAAIFSKDNCYCHRWFRDENLLASKDTLILIYRHFRTVMCLNCNHLNSNLWTRKYGILY